MNAIKLEKMLMFNEGAKDAELWRRSKMLSSLCSNVLVSSSEGEAINILEANKDVQLVVTEITLPNGDGGELISYIIKNDYSSGRRHIPIILISGDPDIKRKLYDSQSELSSKRKKDLRIKYLTKPTSIKDLALRIEEMVYESEIHLLGSSSKRLELLLQDLCETLDNRKDKHVDSNIVSTGNI